MIGLSPLATFCLGDHAKKVAKNDKANHGWENTQLLCAFEVKVSNKLLARYKLLGPS